MNSKLRKLLDFLGALQTKGSKIQINYWNLKKLGWQDFLSNFFRLISISFFILKYIDEKLDVTIFKL